MSPGLKSNWRRSLGSPCPFRQWLDEDDTLHEETLRTRIVRRVQSAYDEKAAGIGPSMRQLEKQIMLQVLDTLWKEHLQVMDQLRQGIHLRAYANKNPKQEYKRESFALFESLLQRLKYEVVRFLSNVQVQRLMRLQMIEQQRREAAAKQKMAFEHAKRIGGSEPADVTPRRGTATDDPYSSPRSGEMIPVPVVAARSTSSAMEALG